MQQIADWLKKLGMSEYAQRFVENRIDLSVLPDLTDQDLEKLGVLLGDRRKMLRAIRDLGGVSVTATEPSAPEATELTRRDDAERRQLSVMFTDLVGSTALSTKLDPEDLRSVIGAYHRCVAETVARFDGFVAKYMGDGVLAYFGYPQAHEHDAERAVRTGLALVEAVPKLRGVIAALLHVRVGIATGVVVVGDLIGSGEAQERGIVGETPNLAARLQAVAQADTVVIAESTRKLLGNLFELNDLGSQQLKGLAAPTQAFAVVRPSSVESRFEALHAAALTTLVGRDEEIELLMRRWEQVKSGQGRVVLLTGEPGIGKSRITVALQECVQSDPHTRLRHFCSPHHQDSALHPVIGQLERAAGLARDDTAEEKLAKLETLLDRSNAQPDEIGFIAELLSIPNEGRYPLPELSPQKRKEKTLTALLGQLKRLAARQPVLAVYEDVHWIDPTTLELLTLMIEQVQCLPVLLLITARPEFKQSWPAYEHVTDITLRRMGRTEGASLIGQVTGGKSLPKMVVDRIIDRTDGVPLFIEELTKTVIESGMLTDAGDRYTLAGPLRQLAIPATLHASLIERLDRLGPAKEVAQIGATIGREFSYELLAAVADRTDTAIQTALGQLVGAGLVFRRGLLPEATFLFKHALVQDAAYGTLLKRSRQHLHGRIARVLEGRFPDWTAAQPELVAHHYEEALLSDQAIGYWEKAGELAVWRSAMAEAVAHFTKALDLLTNLPESAYGKRKELALQLSLAGALMVNKGWASPQMGHAYARACDLARELGEFSQLMAALFGLYYFRHNRAEIDAGRQVVEELLDFAKQHNDRDAKLLAHTSFGASCLFHGEFADALMNMAKGLGYYDPSRHRPSISIPSDARVRCKSFTAWTLLFQGYPDRALVNSEEALAYARELSSPYALAFALHVNCVFQQVRGDREALMMRSEELVAIATEQAFPHLLATGTFFRCWARFMACGPTDEIIGDLHRAVEAKRATGAEIKVPYYLGLLSKAHRKANAASKALCLLEDALDIVGRTGERWFEAELHRLRGEALLKSFEPDHTEDFAAASFRRAQEIASRQGARLWALRAGTSLARLWRDQGKRQQAHDLLAPVYGWFTEGFDTVDLKDAKLLLEQLKA